MTGVRFALVAAVSAVVLGLSASAGAASASTSSGTVTSGSAGASGAADCLAHVVGGLSEDWYDYYTPGCTGHDEPELDPVSSAPGSAQNITWRVALPADGTFPVSSVGPTFWFGGTVKDTNPHKIGGEGFLELQFYPDSFTTRCTPSGGFRIQHEPDVYTACSPVWTIQRAGNSRSSSRPRSTACSRTPRERARSSCTPSTSSTSTSGRRRRTLGLPGAGHGRDQRADVERARAQQPEATAR